MAAARAGPAALGLVCFAFGVCDAQTTGAQEMYASEHACAGQLMMDFGGNPTYVNYSSPQNATVSCGYAPVVGLVADSSDFTPPAWYQGAMVVNPLMRGPLQCQAQCVAAPDCDYFVYGWERNQTDGAEYHECFLKAAYGDELCNENPYVVWTGNPNETWWGESGPGMPCDTVAETEMACGGQIGMNFGANPTYSYVNYTRDAGVQINETILVECGDADVLTLIANDVVAGGAQVFGGTVTINENLTSPLLCQQSCLETDGCDYFAYKWQLSGNATVSGMYHECYLKAAYEDVRCNDNPYTPWIAEDAQWHGQSGPAVPCASLTELTAACGAQPAMDYGGNPTYSYVNYTVDAGDQINETVVVECGYAPTIALITDSTSWEAPGWYGGDLLVFENMTSPVQCQAQCAVTSGCFAFSYEWEYDADRRSMFHECYLKSGPYEDERCAAEPYVPWTTEDAMWHGQSGPPTCGPIEVEMVAFSPEEALQAAEDVMNAFVEVQAMLTVPTAEIGSAIAFPIPIDTISCSQTSVDAGDLIGRRLQFGGLGDLGLQIDIPCPPRIIFEKVFISMMSSGLGGFPPDKIFINQIAEPIFCTGADGVSTRGPCAEGDTESTEGPFACDPDIVPCQSGGGVEVTFHLVVPEPIAELAGSLLNTLAETASEVLAIGAAQAGPMQIPTVMQGPPMSLALAPPPPPPQKCDTEARYGCTDGTLVDPLASCVLDECNNLDFGNANTVCCTSPAACTTAESGTCTAGTVADPTGTCAGITCTSSDFGDQNSRCCTVPASCSSDNSRSCGTGTVKDDSSTCAGAACADADFGEETTNCCTLPAECGSITEQWINQQHPDHRQQWRCQSPAIKVDTLRCAGLQCAPSDFGNAETTCCVTPCSAEASTYACPTNFVLDPEGFCDGYCANVNYGYADSTCCARPANCPSDTTRTCSGGAVDDPEGKCAGPVCTDVDFGYASAACCKASPPVNVVLSLAKDIESIPQGSAARQQFESHFRSDVGNRLGVGANRITIVSITAGSIDVAFQVQPDSNGGPIAVSTITNSFNHVGISIAGTTTLEVVTEENMAAANPPPAPPPTTRQRSKEAPTPWGLIIGGLIVIGAAIALVAGAYLHHVCQKGKGSSDEQDATDNPLSTE